MNGYRNVSQLVFVSTKKENTVAFLSRLSLGLATNYSNTSTLSRPLTIHMLSLGDAAGGVMEDVYAHDSLKGW